MAHTYTNLLYHIVFSTKERLPLIKQEQKEELHAYLVSLINEKGGKILIINSMPDHVHILVALPPDVSVSDLMKFVKANSSRWMKQRFNKPFAWQKGFGAFSVARSGVDALAKYVQDQEIHHRKFDFENEFITILRKNEVDFDMKFCGNRYAVVFDDSHRFWVRLPTSCDVGYTNPAVFDGFRFVG